MNIINLFNFNINFFKLYAFFLVSNGILSIRFFLNYKYTLDQPITFYIIYIFFLLIVYFLLNNKLFKIHFFLNRYFFSFFLLSISIILIYQYPIQDNLKLFNLGSDQDDCIKDMIFNLLNLNYPYQKTYLGNPCSTGFLEIIFYSPIIISDKYFAFIPAISTFFFFLSIRNYIDSNESYLISYLIFTNLIFLELCISGSDYIIISTSYVVGISFLLKGLKNKSFFFQIIGYVFLCFFYSSRIVFIFIMLLNFFTISIYNKKVNIPFIIILFIVFSSYTLMYLISPENFPNFHLFYKGYSLLNDNKLLLIISVFLISFLFLYYYRLLKQIFISQNFLILFNSLIFILPMLFLSFAGFSFNNLASWEEINYTILVLPSIYFSTFIFLKNKIE